MQAACLWRTTPQLCSAKCAILTSMAPFQVDELQETTGQICKIVLISPVVTMLNVTLNQQSYTL